MGLKDEESDSYAECYPGALEHDHAIYDSDEEGSSKKSGGGGKKTKQKNVESSPEKNKMPKSQNIKALDRDLKKIDAILAKKKGHQQDAGHGDRS